MEKLLDIHALSDALSIPVGSIRNALWRGQAGEVIPAPIRLGRRLRWRETDVESFLHNHRTGTSTLDEPVLSETPHRRGRPSKREQLERMRKTAQSAANRAFASAGDASSIPAGAESPEVTSRKGPMP